MKLSTLQMIAVVCILSVGFVSVAPVFLQEANADADAKEREVYAVYSKKTKKFIRYETVSEWAVHTDHYTYYHYPGSATAAWDHYQTWPDGHPYAVRVTVIGKKWV